MPELGFSCRNKNISVQPLKLNGASNGRCKPIEVFFIRIDHTREIQGQRLYFSWCFCFVLSQCCLWAIVGYTDKLAELLQQFSARIYRNSKVQARPSWKVIGSPQERVPAKRLEGLAHDQ